MIDSVSLPLLKVDALIKEYGGQRVVNELNLTLKHGKVLGLLGPNGAGKTTTLRMLYGLIKPDGGEIVYEGRDFVRFRTDIKRWIGVCTQQDTLDEDFNVEQNLFVHASYFRPKVEGLKERVSEMIHQFGLVEVAKQTPRRLSGGYRRRLMLARSVIHRPRILFLDEPTTGLDPKARVDLWELIRVMKKHGLGIILTTHYMDEAERLSDELVVLSRGQTVASGVPSRVLGEMLGEHVVIIEVDSGRDVEIRDWAEIHIKNQPNMILGELHLPMSAVQLGKFSTNFEGLRFQVRSPNLDDLFQRLTQPHANGAES